MNFNMNLPPQPLYEKYIKSRGVSQRTPAAQALPSQYLAARVDVMRMSQNIQKNLLRESVKNGYQQKEVEAHDLKLDNRDQVVDFGEYKEEEEEETTEEETPSEAAESEKDSVLEEEIGYLEEEKVETIIEKETRPITIQGKQRNTQIIVEDERPSTAHQRVNSAQPTPQSKQTNARPPPPIEQIIIHTSDTSVKPIIGNREMEKQGDLTYNAQNLGFQA